MVKRVAVVGAGISGLSVAHLLKDCCEVKVFEKNDAPGGLIRCSRINGSLFHICGGHVFNTKNENVSAWFWNLFDKEKEFVVAKRRAAICLENCQFVDYPIERHVYQLDKTIQEAFYADMDSILRNPTSSPENFDDFLQKRFGNTLYNIYFKPYNEKIWRCALSDIPLEWLEGKLPMPTPREMLDANKKHLEEDEIVHSTFYYAKNNGSQFIADKLSKGLNVSYDDRVVKIECLKNGGVRVNGERFDELVFCGNVKDLPRILDRGIELGSVESDLENLQSHGTTSVFCETDAIPYSWFYQPDRRHKSHRFICTGNFSPTNNAVGKMTCTVEFSDGVPEDEIFRQLNMMPFHPIYITHNYTRYSYPVQNPYTRKTIATIKDRLFRSRIWLVGRFAEWEYFNMDAAIASAMVVANRIKGVSQ